MPEIRIQVTNKIATNLTSGTVIVCGNSDYEIVFLFDEEWEAEPIRTARFTYTRNGQSFYKECTFQGSFAPVPILSGIREVQVGVYAGELHTTTPARVICRPSILCGNAVEQITPAEKAGLQSQVDRLTLEVDDLKENGTGGNQPGISTPARTLLWENPAPDVAFGEQTIPLPDMSQYDGVEIVYSSLRSEEWQDGDMGNYETTKTGMYSTGFVPIRAGENPIMLEQTRLPSGLDAYDLTYRRCVVVTVGTVCSAKVEVAHYPNNFGNPDSETFNCVPLHIYGIKSGLVTRTHTGTTAPLILDANLSDYYGGHPEAGDEALEAIKSGRQILVRVPNADGGSNTAIYTPIMMYQVPLNGMYLYMFYLRDEKQDLSPALGLPAGTVQLPTYGEFMMLLSQEYHSNPLES